jgi:Hemerythrin HHE cation binding domain
MTTNGNDIIVSFDLYRNIHKAIRSELFGTTLAAGSLDPADDKGRVELAERVERIGDLLVEHAAHEDEHVQPHIERHVPRLAHQIEADHHAIEARLPRLTSLADAAASARAGEVSRRRLHDLYLELASFTSTYLAHQDVEERLVMPALSAAMPVSDLIAVNDAIVSSIPPDQMATALGLMLPALNVDDRAELLGGLQAGAPPEVFAGVVGLAQSVLVPGDFAAVTRRLGLAA